MILRWLFSTTVRNAVAMRKQVHRFLCAQRDVLSPVAFQAVSGALLDFQKALDVRVDKATLKKEMARLEAVANKWLKQYPHATMRENVEVLLVALAVAMAIRTFFLQPFKIPTGSMQPTLFGVDFQKFDRRQRFSRFPPAGNGSRNGLKAFPMFMSWRRRTERLTPSVRCENF